MSLQDAIAQLDRAFGKGTLRLLGEDTDFEEVEVISSGSLALDIALSRGGLPRGRITEIYGPESSGKCLTADCHVIGEEGLTTIEELFSLRGFKATCTNRIVDHKVSLLNEHGEPEHTSHLTWNNRRPVKRIETSLGTVVKATAKHPIRVLDKNGFIVWRRADQVKPGDIVPIMRGSQAGSHRNVITEREAVMLGYLIADGANAVTKRVHFSNSDPDVIRDFQNCVETVYEGAMIRSYNRDQSSSVEHHINSKAIRRDLYDRLDLGYDLSADKTVPLSVRRSSLSIQKAFLRSYLELECSLDASKRGMEVTSSSRILLEQVQLMLLNMGFVGRLARKPVNGVTYWRLTYSGYEGYRLATWIGFQSAERLASVALFAEETNGSTNIDSIPHMGMLLKSLYDAHDLRSREICDLIGSYSGEAPKANLTYNRLRLIVEAFEAHAGEQSHPIILHLRDLLDRHLFFATVVSVDDDEAPTFDVCLPTTHSFWSNGLISHNTTLALHAIANAQRGGGNAVFIDAEHALDTAYARKLGVNVPKLYLTQPNSGEEALEIADRVIKSRDVAILVVDSVAALVPKSELEGAMGDQKPGAQARLMSQAMRKLTAAIKATNTCVIFINQIRHKIGVIYGSPETTSGGNALKFGASVRLDIRRGQAIKDGENALGHISTVKVVKSKIGPPLRKVEIEILFGEGISRIPEILNLGILAGSIKHGGAWFTIGEQRLQGKDKAKEYLIDNPHVADQIEAEIRAKAGLISSSLID